MLIVVYHLHKKQLSSSLCMQDMYVNNSVLLVWIHCRELKFPHLDSYLIKYKNEEGNGSCYV